jgi:hypothetical protein
MHLPLRIARRHGGLGADSRRLTAVFSISVFNAVATTALNLSQRQRVPVRAVVLEVVVRCCGRYPAPMHTSERERAGGGRHI